LAVDTLHAGSGKVTSALGADRELLFVDRLDRAELIVEGFTVNDVLNKEYCREVYTKLTLEVIKVLNYYYFNNRESALDRIYFGGGVSALTSLCHSIADATNLVYRPLYKLIPDKMDETEAADGVLAIGLLMQ
jgi:Tfp pilus assembly PilM family ATPase